MIYRIKNTIERQLAYFIQGIDRKYSLSKISPLLFNNIKEFVLRNGKRLRPILFVIGYKGFSKSTASNLYQSALAIELLHDFMLVHDDIIDKSDTRRGKPSMHKALNSYLSSSKKNLKFNGQDLTIVVGDVMYAIAINAFLSIKADFKLKEKALRKFIEAAIYTGSGEFIELLGGMKSLEAISKRDIYNIYDFKTARYTFSAPLATGAILAGAPDSQTKKLSDFGIMLGRAFQIKDDILGMFAEESKIGKSTLADLQEAKKTLLVWYAYNHTNNKNRVFIKKLFSRRIQRPDLYKMREIIQQCGALQYAQKEVSGFINKAGAILNSSTMRPEYKAYLQEYTDKLLDF